MQQDYHGRRVYVIISDDTDDSIESKIDLGVHKNLNIEQKELEADAIRLEKEIEIQETQIKNIETFIQKSGHYVGIEKITSYILHELVKAIYVDAPDKSSGKRTQHIHIQYD